MEVIEQLAIAKDIEPCHVVRCALRLYQMEHEGTIQVRHVMRLWKFDPTNSQLPQPPVE
jgi:hypothetical protein